MAWMTSQRRAARPLDWRSATWAAALGGLAMLLVVMVLVPIATRTSPFVAPRIMAALLIGRAALPPPSGFQLGLFVVGMMVHFTLSVAFTFAFASVVRGLGAAATIAAGAVFAVGIYVLDFYVLAGAFPWVVEARGAGWLLAHLTFGVVMSGALHALRRRRGRLAPALR